MKKMSKVILVSIALIVVFYTILLMIPQKDITYLDDNSLRKYALSHGLSPIPKDYKNLLKVVDNVDNPMNPSKIELGKKLFFDPILSLDKSISCASCHILKDGGDDNLPTAIGYHGRENPKHLNSPTVLNSALAKSQFWNGRAKDVEEQAGGPIQAPFEMNITPLEAVKRVSGDKSYISAFDLLFDGDISFKNIRNAIGAYERTLLTRGDYDRFLEGDNSAINASAKRGMNLFIQKGCKGCHTGMSVGGQSMQYFPLRRAMSDVLYSRPFPFENIGGFLGKDNEKRFRVPILRNITKTAPYFHNGAVKDLKEAIRIMSKYQVGDEFTPKEIEDMVEFFKTLEGNLVSYDINITPYSNLESINLQGMDFTHRDLHGINFKNANLTNCNFFGANLSGSNLTGAKIKGVNFTSTDLSFATLSYLDFQGLDLIETKLERANFVYAIWRNGMICKDGSIGKCIY